MNQHVVEVKVPNAIAVVTAKIEGMSIKKNAPAPISAVTAKGAEPRPLLLPCTTQEEYGAKASKMRGRYPLQSVLDLRA